MHARFDLGDSTTALARQRLGNIVDLDAQMPPRREGAVRLDHVVGPEQGDEVRRPVGEDGLLDQGQGRHDDAGHVRQQAR